MPSRYLTQWILNPSLAKYSYCDNELSNGYHKLNARSNMEAKPIAFDSTYTEAKWIRNFLSETPIIHSRMPPIIIHCESKFAIKLCKHENTNDKMHRHIQIWHKSVWRHLKHNIMSIKSCSLSS